jgi:hypothetical protein
MASGQVVRIDPAALRKVGEQLRVPGTTVTNAFEDAESGANAVKGHDGLPPWGNGEIGDAFAKEYLDNANKILAGVRDLGLGLGNLADKFTASAKLYDVTESSNSGK